MSAPIGFVGAGVMGSSMVRRLLLQGHAVLVFARTPAKAAELVALGAEVTSDLGAVSDRCDVVIGCLLDDAAIEAVYVGADHPGTGEPTGSKPTGTESAGAQPTNTGLVARSRPGQVFVEHGTFSPGLAERIAGAAAERGARFFDAPVTGGPEGAAAGTLVIMAGAGEAGIPSAVAALLNTYSSAIHLTGPAGTGAQLKLVNQLLVSVHMAVAAEAAALLARTSIDAGVALDVLGSGWAASTMLARELPLALAGDFAGRGATVGGLVHVQELIATAFAAAGVAPRLLPAAQAMFAEATRDGFGASDPAALVRLYDGATPAAASPAATSATTSASASTTAATTATNGGSA